MVVPLSRVLILLTLLIGANGTLWSLSLLPISEENRQTFDLLVQDYEREFAPLTGKEPGPDGLYALDTQPRPPYEGYYLRLSDGELLGFVIVGIIDGSHDIAEFYIKPEARRKGHGMRMAHLVFDRYKGPWQVRQIEGADAAKAFWRRCIGLYTGGAYVDEVVEDPDWGLVTRQRFLADRIPSAAS